MRFAKVFQVCGGHLLSSPEVFGAGCYYHRGEIPPPFPLGVEEAKEAIAIF